MKKTFIVSIWLCLAFAIHAEKDPFKFGKIEIAELQNNTCPVDSNAEAYMIGDYGTTYIDFGTGNLVYERHYRMKIVNKNGYDWAMQRLPYWDGDNISGLKAVTYNLEGNNIIKSELNSDNKVTEKKTDFLRSLNFAMPNVKEGSIIEVKFKLYSGSFHIPSWYFQYSIPVLESRYIVKIPEFFNYKKLTKGYVNIQYTTESENTSIDGFSYTENIDKYLTHYVPALKTEAYIDCIDNYRASLDYELASYQFPGRMLYNFNSTYEKMNESLLKEDNFYLQLNSLLLFGDELDTIKAKYTQPYDQMAAAYNYIRTNMKWNKVCRVFVTESIRKAYKEHTGSSSDINMLLTCMLRKIGLDAEPVILSTRANGKLFPSQPMLSAFDYVVARVKIGDKSYLLDATDKYCPLGTLPARCLNGEGRIISENAYGWQKLSSPQAYKVTTYYQLALNDAGDLTGTSKQVSKDYAALDFRNTYSNFTSKDEYVKNIENSNAGLKINELQIDDLDSINKPVVAAMKLELANRADIQGDMMYINPMIIERRESNPFKLEERKYPVDFNYPKDETSTIVINLPDGYTIEETPKSTVFALPANAGKYAYNFSVNGNTVIINRKYTISKQMFTIDEYLILKEFFNQIVAKEAEMIVLKKKA